MQPKGSAHLDGAHATLTFRRVYPHAAQHVWDALATPEGLREWLMCTYAQIEGRVGGQIELVSGQGRYHSTGKVLTWDPPHVLEYEWNVAPVPEMPQGERAIFRYELAETRGLSEPAGAADRVEAVATEVLVTYRRLTPQTARGFLPGLHAFLDRLEAQLAGRALPDWLQLFGELRSAYPEWSDHASPPGK